MRFLADEPLLTTANASQLLNQDSVATEITLKWCQNLGFCPGGRGGDVATKISDLEDHL
jgi:hypothetical protein